MTIWLRLLHTVVWKTKFQVCPCTFIEKFKLRRCNIFLVYEFVLERNERPKQLFMSYNALFAGQCYVYGQKVCNMQK